MNWLRLGGALVVLLFLLSGCGESTACEEDANSRACFFEELERSEGTGAGGQRNTERQPSPDRKRSPATVAQEVARDICGASSQARIAKEFGVPNELTAVVEAYGEGSTELVRPASERGCLEGLSE